MSYNEPPGDTDNLLILRGFCSLGVVIVHCISIVPAYSLAKDLGFLNPSTGANFVIIFFMLSGYLMGKIYRTGRYRLTAPSIKTFYWNRFLRIAPLLFFNLEVSLVLWLTISGTSWVKYAPILGDFLFINNLTGRVTNPVTWSISYEMQDYLIFPVIVWLFGSRAKRSVLACIATTAALFILSFTTKTVLLKWTWVFLCGFMVNDLVRYMVEEKGITGSKWKTLAGFGLFLTANIVFYVVSNIVGVGAGTYALLIATCLVALALFELPYREGDTATRRAGTWLGRISYGVYLWHMTIILVLLRTSNLARNPDRFTGLGIFTGLVVALTLLISVATFFLIEVQFRPSLYREKKAVQPTPSGQPP